MIVAPETLQRARDVAPGFDPAVLHDEWLARLAVSDLAPDDFDEPDDAFLAFAEDWARRQR